MARNKSPWFLLQFLNRHIPDAVASIFLSAAAVMFGVGLIGTSAYLISYAALQPSIAVLQVAIVGVRFFGLSKAVFRYMERLASHAVNFKMLANLRVWVYRLCLPLIPSRNPDISSGDILSSAVEDVETLEFFFIRIVNPPFAALLTGFFTAIIFNGFHPDLVANFLILFIVSSAVSLLAAYIIAQLSSKQLISTRAALHQSIIEYQEGLPDLLVYRMDDRNIHSIHIAESNYHHQQIKAAWGTGLTSGLVVLLTNISMVLMLVNGIVLVGDGRLDAKLLAVVALITIASMEAVQLLPASGQQVVIGKQAGDRILRLVKEEGELEHLWETHPPSAEPTGLILTTPDVLTVDKINFAYGKNTSPFLENISLQVSPGDKVAIVGPSGAGKTTLARLMAGFWQSDSGTIRFGSQNFAQLTERQIRAVVTYSGQNAYFFHDTLRANLNLAQDYLSEDKILEALRICELSEFLDELPNGLDTIIGERGMKLSEGEKRRLDLARAMLRKTPVFILDEPFAGVDVMTEEKILKNLLSALVQPSLILITHRLVGMERMDNIIVLDSGRVSGSGTHLELMIQNSLYRELWDNQHSIID